MTDPYASYPAGFDVKTPEPNGPNWGLAFMRREDIYAVANQGLRNLLCAPPAPPPLNVLQSQLTAYHDDPSKVVALLESLLQRLQGATPSAPEPPPEPTRWLSSTAAARAARRRLQDVLRLSEEAVKAGVARPVGRGAERRHVRWHPERGPAWIAAQQKPVQPD